MAEKAEKKETALVKAAAVSETPFAMMAVALNKGAGPETLKQLMELQERWDARNAKKAFIEAMAAFKAEAPSVLRKDGEVDFANAQGKRTSYTHATLGGIITEITPFLSKHGLSASWATAQEPSGVRVTCFVTHCEGHSESTSLVAPPDNSGNKNAIQMVGSSVTYLQRYTLLALLGLATADMDDDGIGSGARPGVDAPPAGKPVVLRPEVLPPERKERPRMPPVTLPKPPPVETPAPAPESVPAAKTTVTNPPPEPKKDPPAATPAKPDFTEPKDSDPDDKTPPLKPEKTKQIIDLYGKLGITQRALEIMVGVKASGWTEADKQSLLLPQYTKALGSAKFVEELKQYNNL